MSTMHYPRTLEAPRRSFFLFGARGTGKSTWALDVLPDAERFDLRDEDLFQTLVREPGRFAGMLRRVDRGRWVVVDEVQRLPGLLNEVHRDLDTKAHRFALLGWSARKLRRAGQNLLGGRASALTFFPFTPAELGGDFDLDESLRLGLLPVVLMDPEPPAALKAYAQTYVRDEVQAEALVRSLPSFSRFLAVAAVMHGQVLNVSTLSRDAGVQRTTVNSYLEVLEDTLLAVRLPAFEAKLRVRERSHPKLYFFDAGLVRALKRHTGALTVDERGPLFEGLVAHILRAHLANHGLEGRLSYWASQNLEVDFVLDQGGSRRAWDVTCAVRLHDADFRGLRALRELPGLVQRTVVYAGRQAFNTDDGIEVVPLATFVRELASFR